MPTPYVAREAGRYDAKDRVEVARARVVDAALLSERHPTDTAYIAAVHARCREYRQALIIAERFEPNGNKSRRGLRRGG